MSAITVTVTSPDINLLPTPAARSAVASGALGDATGSAGIIAAVGAVNAAGVKASYSNTGSTLWVSGLGGEFGQERKATKESGAPLGPRLLRESGAHGKTSRVADAHLYAPALVAPDTMGVARGMNRDSPGNPRFNALDSGSLSAIEPGGNYTARKIDPDRPKLVWQGLVLDDGWVTNAAGRALSNWYGFGLVDATAAVRAAERHVPLGPLRNTGWLATEQTAVSILAKDAGGTGARIVADQDMKIETVQLRLRTTHQDPNRLHIVLTSPSGTRSIVLPAHTMVKLVGDAFSIDLTACNAFLDESARGTWTLQVSDAKDPAPSGGLVSWELRVLGR